MSTQQSSPLTGHPHKQVVVKQAAKHKRSPTSVAQAAEQILSELAAASRYSGKRRRRFSRASGPCGRTSAP
jgi:hypothetical protein